jgi:hypothetical protein
MAAVRPVFDLQRMNLMRPITSCRQTMSALTLRTASRSAGNMKRRLNVVKPLWMLIVSTFNENLHVCSAIFLRSMSLS